MTIGSGRKRFCEEEEGSQTGSGGEKERKERKKVYKKENTIKNYYSQTVLLLFSKHISMYFPLHTYASVKQRKLLKINLHCWVLLFYYSDDGLCIMHIV